MQADEQVIELARKAEIGIYAISLRPDRIRNRERLTFTSLKKADKLLNHVESIKHLEGHRFDRIMVATRTTKVEAKPDALWVSFEGPNAPEAPT